MNTDCIAVHSDVLQDDRSVRERERER